MAADFGQVIFDAWPVPGTSQKRRCAHERKESKYPVALTVLAEGGGHRTAC
jgi:hypothetical protein